MTVSMRVMSAGDGYKYLLRTVAAGDGNRSLSSPLTRYYMEAGTPSGTWLGGGVASLGDGQLAVGDHVSEAQLQLLAGMGRDPITGEPLGLAYPAYRSQAERIEARITALVASYHRHQVPNDSGLTAWAQFLHADGTPAYPQRSVQIGPLITSSVTGGGVFTGKLTMKTILVANLLDADAFPWQADWYADRVKNSLGVAVAEENFRLWLTDNADHLSDGGAGVIGSGAPQIPRSARLIDYTGILFQAILDVADWVEKEHEPAASTSYSVNDQQLVLEKAPRQRGGVQPTVEILADSGDTLRVHAGEAVRLRAKVQSPTTDNLVVGAEWDFLGTGEFVPGEVESRPKSTLVTKTTYTFSEPGTYFVTVRATAKRDGSSAAPGLENLGRVRVVVD